MHAAYNRASYAATRQVFWQMMRRSVNEASRDILGIDREPLLGPYRRVELSGEPWLNAWSPEILPHSPEWPSNVRTTGYWSLETPEGWRPPAILRDFLENGPAPVSVGFGSMTSEDPERMTEAVLGALRSCGLRGILLTGWGGISNADLPDDVIKVDEAPHDWLFGKACAALHHGGAGTTAASLHSGLPTITVPFFADQRFWGSRVAALAQVPLRSPPTTPPRRRWARRSHGQLRTLKLREPPVPWAKESGRIGACDRPCE
jgi:sterol 3beta-glucosyltransferase